MNKTQVSLAAILGVNGAPVVVWLLTSPKPPVTAELAGDMIAIGVAVGASLWHFTEMLVFAIWPKLKGDVAP